jgi:hypothetical protein
MGQTVDHAAATPADPFTAVMVKRNGILSLMDEVLVDHIEHFQKRHVRGDVFGLISFEIPLVTGTFLPPYLESQMNGLAHL